MSQSAPSPSEKRWLVVFAAQGIQTYVLRSDKLREIVGASELVESMAYELLDNALSQAGIADPATAVLSRAAGGARILFATETLARNFARIWVLLVARHAPGLPVVVAVRPVSGHPVTTIYEAEREIPSLRAFASADLPEAGPFVARHGRSGRPVADDFRDYNDGEFSPADAETGRKEAAVSAAHGRLLGKLLARPLSGAELDRDWPLDVADIAGEHGGLAIFHADGNGLGQAVMALLHHLKTQPGDNALRVYSNFCTQIEQATLAALRLALAPIEIATRERREKKKLSLKIPFRPLVCAGDDVTAILRAEDAMEFAAIFLRTMEREIRKRLKTQGLEFFTACGALVYTRPNFPFADAYTLCETMCAAAKKAVERKHSALSFVRVASALPGDYGDFVARERTLQGDRCLTMNPYLLGAAEDGLPALAHLQALVTLMREQPRGALRETVTAAYDSPATAATVFARFLEVRGKEQADKFRAAFRHLTGSATGDRLWTDGLSPRTPLHDALELISVSGEISSQAAPAHRP